MSGPTIEQLAALAAKGVPEAKMLLSMRTSAVRNQDDQVSLLQQLLLQQCSCSQPAVQWCLLQDTSTLSAYLEAQTSHLLCFSATSVACRTGAGETWPMQSTRSRNRARSRRPARNILMCLQSTGGSLHSGCRRHNGPARCGLTSSWPPAGASRASRIIRPKGSQTRLQSVRGAGRQVGQAVWTPSMPW